MPWQGVILWCIVTKELSAYQVMRLLKLSSFFNCLIKPANYTGTDWVTHSCSSWASVDIKKISFSQD